MEIEIRRETAATIAVSLLLLVFGLIGYAASPRDDANRPVLLLPDVRAVEEYRRSVSGGQSAGARWTRRCKRLLPVMPVVTCWL